MTWFNIAFQDALTHVVHRELLTSLLVDMLAREHPMMDYEARYGVDYARATGGNPRQTRQWAFDLGGAMHMHAPIETLEIDGLSVEVSCEHFELVRASIAKSELRTFPDGAMYHKLKFWHHATVLTPGQHQHVLELMARRGDEASKRARAFHEHLRAVTGASSLN